MEQNRSRRTNSRGNYLAARAKTAGSALAVALLAATLFAMSGSSLQAQTQSVAAEPQQIKLTVKERGKQTSLKLVVEGGAVTKVTATDSAGTRSLKRTDKLASACADAEKECKTVELEGGILLGICCCPDTQVALLLPAVQKVRAAAARMSSAATGSHVVVFDGTTEPSTVGHVKVFDGSTGAEIMSVPARTFNGLTIKDDASSSGHVKVFSGATGAEIRSDEKKPVCWADEKLKLSICLQ